MKRVGRLSILLLMISICGCMPDREEAPVRPEEAISVRFTDSEGVKLQEIVIDLPDLPPDAKPLTLVRIPAGSFQMGSPDYEHGRYEYEGPVRTVTIGYDFYMGKYPVTQAQWEAVMGSNPAEGHGVGDNYPVYSVSWNDIRRTNGFLDRLNAKIHGKFRLPSEAEWEYACRAGTSTMFSFGDGDFGMGEYAWYRGNSNRRTHPVGQKLPNAWGLYDMHGLVWEWCEDYWHESYNGAPDDGSPWLSPSSRFRVMRGGSWNEEARNCRCAVRSWETPNYQSTILGFRLATTP